MPTVKPWDKRPDETEGQFRHFRYYLEMERGKRTYMAVSKAFKLRPRGKKKDHPSKSIDSAQAEHDWSERVQAYDAHMDSILEGKAEDLEKEKAELWAERRESQREQVFTTVQKLISVCDKLLEKSLVMMGTPTHTKVEVEDADGKRTVIEPTGNWNLSDAARFAKAGADLVTAGDKLFRLAAGMETERIRFDFDLDELSDDALKRIEAGAAPEQVIKDARLIQ